MPAPRFARFGISTLLAVVLACAAAPAEASKNTGKKKPSAPPLDLVLRQGDLALVPVPPRRPDGYAVSLGADPWSALEGHGAFGPEPGVPKRRRALDGEGVETEEVVLRKLLEGETIPLLRIRMSPEPR
jgi:hypothetical protein